MEQMDCQSFAGVGMDLSMPGGSELRHTQPVFTTKAFVCHKNNCDSPVSGACHTVRTSEPADASALTLPLL